MAVLLLSAVCGRDICQYSWFSCTAAGTCQLLAHVSNDVLDHAGGSSGAAHNVVRHGIRDALWPSYYVVLAAGVVLQLLLCLSQVV